jgi:hypothetical protein
MMSYVLDHLFQHLVVWPEKSSFVLTKIDFLGHIILVDGIHIQNPEKVNAVAEWAHPKNKKSLKMFLGFTNFYCHFII